MKLTMLTSLAGAASIITGIRMVASGQAWLGALCVLVGIVGVLIGIPVTERLLGRGIERLYLYALRRHRSCLKAHPDQSHDEFMADFLPRFTAHLAQKRRTAA